MDEYRRLQAIIKGAKSFRQSRQAVSNAVTIDSDSIIIIIGGGYHECNVSNVYSVRNGQKLQSAEFHLVERHPASVIEAWVVGFNKPQTPFVAGRFSWILLFSWVSQPDFIPWVMIAAWRNRKKGLTLSSSKEVTRLVSSYRRRSEYIK